MKWYFNLNRKIQIAIPLICFALCIIFFIVGGTTFLIIGAIFLVIGIPFIFMFDHAEKQRKAEQSAARQKNSDPEIKESDSTDFILALARKRADEVIQTGDDNAVRSRLDELDTLIMPEEEREKLHAPSDTPIIQRQLVLLYETQVLMQYLTDKKSSSAHELPSTETKRKPEKEETERHEHECRISAQTSQEKSASSGANASINPIVTVEAVSGPKEKQASAPADRVERPTYHTITVVDFEIANNSMTSICAIGLCRIDDGKIVGREHYLIQPPENRYDADMTAVHGITPDMTKDAEPFPVVWDKIKQHFQNTYVAAHNAKRFDMPALKAVLEHYGIEKPHFDFIDTMYVCDKYKDASCRRSLGALCEAFGIPLTDHHNALCDAEAAANLILYSFEHSRFHVFATWLRYSVDLYPFDEVAARSTFKNGKHEHLDVHEIAATTSVHEEADKDFDGKTFLFTGTLQFFTREEAMRKVVERGGIIKNGISSKIDVLVNANPDNVTTTKVEKALAMQKEGHPIKIISEEQFLEMLESNDAIQI